jgi:hypothetical protein
MTTETMRAPHETATPNGASPARTVVLPERSARRLGALRAAAEGAQLVVDAAVAQQKQLAERYQQAVAGVLEGANVDLDGQFQVAHDVERGTLVVSPASPP